MRTTAVFCFISYLRAAVFLQFVLTKGKFVLYNSFTIICVKREFYYEEN